MSQEFGQLVDELKGDYAELRRTVEVRAADAAKGVVDSLVEAKLARINEAISEKEAQRDQLVNELAAEVKRQARAGAETGTSAEAAHLAQFNRELRASAAAAGRVVEGVGSVEEFRSYTAAFDRYLRRAQAGLTPDEQRAMSVGSDPDGGYTVTPAMSSRIVQRVFELSPIRNFATVETIGTDRLEGTNETDDASGGWVGETGTRSDSTTPTVGRYSIVAQEMYAQPKSSQKLLEDSNRDIQAWLVQRTANKFARLEAAGFTTGTGVNSPRGFASYSTAATADSSRTWGTFEHVASGTSASFGTDPTGVQKLIALIHKLNPAYLPNAAFYMNRNTLATVRQLTDASSGGKFVFVPSFQAGMPDTLLGYPVRVVVDMADVAANSLSVAFGDMAATYTIVDRVGLSLLVDPFTDKPNVRFYMRRRVGGDVVNFDSLKFIKFAAS